MVLSLIHICHVAQEVIGTTKIVYNGVEMDLGKPFERITMVDAVKKYAGVDWNTVETLEQARALAKEHNVEFEERHKKGDILSLFFEEFAEEHLIQPAFVTDHPIEISPLTKKKPENPDYVERFEFFMNGWEMANAYSCLLYTSCAKNTACCFYWMRLRQQEYFQSIWNEILLISSALPDIRA